MVATEGGLLEERLAGQTVFLKDLAQTLESFDLNLPYTLTRQTNLKSYIFKRAALCPRKPKRRITTSRCFSVSSDSH